MVGATLSREDKARWLHCAATPDEMDVALRSPDPDIRAAASGTGGLMAIYHLLMTPKLVNG
jgi:hypothetical protein